MKTAYFDCFSGISGNMVLGALIDAGLEVEWLRQELAKLKLASYKIEASRVLKRHIAGTLVDVKTQEEGVERHLGDILDIIERSDLSGEVNGSGSDRLRSWAQRPPHPQPAPGFHRQSC